MAVTTGPDVVCPEGVYTLLATAATNVSLRVKEMLGTTRCRLAVAAALPAPSSTGYVAVSHRKWVELGDLTDNLYLMPLGSAAEIEIIKG